MVKYKTIIDTIDEYIKCNVSMKQIRKSIEPLLKDICDSEEEFEILGDRITRFYYDFYNAPIEHLYLETEKGNIYTNQGEQYNVKLPKDAFEEKGFLLSIHNHPNTMPYPSHEDMKVMSQHREKYNVILSKYGIMVFKHNKGGRIFSTSKTKKILEKTENNLMDKVDNTEKAKALDDEWFGNRANTKLTHDDYINTFTGYVNEYLRDNNGEITSELNDEFKKKDLPLSCYYMTVKQN